MLDTLSVLLGSVKQKIVHMYLCIYEHRIIYARETCAYELPRMQIAFQTRREHRIYLRTFSVRKSKDIADNSEYSIYLRSTQHLVQLML